MTVKGFLPRIARRIFNSLIQLQRRYSSVAPHLGNSVLDIGCGHGELIPLLEKGTRYIGLDVREDRISYCKSTYRDHIFYHLNFEKDALPETITATPFSSLTLLSVIEYFHDPGLVFERCRSLMGSNTRLIIITPTPIGDLVARAFEKMWQWRPDSHPHIRTYSPAALDSICRAHGLVETYHKGIGWHRQFYLAIYARA